MTVLGSGIYSGWRLFLAAAATLIVPVLSAALIGASLGARGAERWPLLLWAAAIPVIYLAWLLAFLTFSAGEMGMHELNHGPKPRRVAFGSRTLTMQAAMLSLSTFGSTRSGSCGGRTRCRACPYSSGSICSRMADGRRSDAKW